MVSVAMLITETLSESHRQAGTTPEEQRPGAGEPRLGMRLYTQGASEGSSEVGFLLKLRSLPESYYRGLLD